MAMIDESSPIGDLPVLSPLRQAFRISLGDQWSPFEAAFTRRESDRFIGEFSGRRKFSTAGPIIRGDRRDVSTGSTRLLLSPSLRSPIAERILAAATLSAARVVVTAGAAVATTGLRGGDRALTPRR